MRPATTASSLRSQDSKLVLSGMVGIEVVFIALTHSVPNIVMAEAESVKSLWAKSVGQSGPEPIRSSVSWRQPFQIFVPVKLVITAIPSGREKLGGQSHIRAQGEIELSDSVVILLNGRAKIWGHVVPPTPIGQAEVAG